MSSDTVAYFAAALSFLGLVLLICALWPRGVWPFTDDRPKKGAQWTRPQRSSSQLASSSTPMVSTRTAPSGSPSAPPATSLDAVTTAPLPLLRSGTPPVTGPSRSPWAPPPR